MQPAIAGERGREALLKAAKSQARGCATPQGSLPAELWQLLLQARPLCPVSVSSIPEICRGALKACSVLVATLKVGAMERAVRYPSLVVCVCVWSKWAAHH